MFKSNQNNQIESSKCLFIRINNSSEIFLFIWFDIKC